MQWNNNKCNLGHIISEGLSYIYAQNSAVCIVIPAQYSLKELLEFQLIKQTRVSDDNKTTDQLAQLCKLICGFVLYIAHRTFFLCVANFSEEGSNNYTCL